MITLEQAKELVKIPLKEMTDEQKKLLPKALKLLANSWSIPK